MEFRNVDILGMQFRYELNLGMFSLVTSKNFMQGPTIPCTYLFLNHPEQKFRFLQPSCMYCIASYIPTCFSAELPCILLKHTCVYNSLPLPLHLYVLLSLSPTGIVILSQNSSAYLSLPISSLPIFLFLSLLFLSFLSLSFIFPPIYSFTSASPPFRSCIQANSANTGFSFRI